MYFINKGEKSVFDLKKWKQERKQNVKYINIKREYHNKDIPLVNKSTKIEKEIESINKIWILEDKI